jgi:hypothetical protein
MPEFKKRNLFTNKNSKERKEEKVSREKVHAPPKLNFKIPSQALPS